MSEYIYSYSTGYCEECRETVPARLIGRENSVFLETLCPRHGARQTRVAGQRWYEEGRAYVKPRQIPLAVGNEKFSGCPDSCGLCPQHRQHTCLPVAEITNRCDLNCPVCLKEPGEDFGMSPDQFRQALDRLAACEGGLTLINFSGGEPTLHPDFAEFLSISRERGVTQASVSTNGLRLLADPALRALFAETGTVASIQFDGFKPETWLRLRGRDLSALKLELIELLEKEGIRYSLTATVARGVNDSEIAAIADFFFASKGLSLMFQPLTITGAARANFAETHRLTVDDVVERLEKSRHIAKGDFNPLPCAHPACFALSYYFQIDGDNFYSLKDFLGRERFLNVVANRTLPGLDREGHEAIRERIYEFWSAGDSAADNRRVLQRIKGILKELDGASFSAKAAFDLGSAVLRSVFIHGFMDAQTFDLGRLVKCCNHYVQPDGRLSPICAHNVMNQKSPGMKR